MKSFLLYYWKLVLRENKWEKLQFGKKHIDSIWPIQILFFQRVSSMNNSRFKAAATLAIPATLTTRYQCHVLSSDPGKKSFLSGRLLDYFLFLPHDTCWKSFSSHFSESLNAFTFFCFVIESIIVPTSEHAVQKKKLGHGICFSGVT